MRARVRLLVEGAQWPHEVETRVDILAALKRLPVLDRTVVVLVAMGYTQAEVGRRLGLKRPDSALRGAERRLAKELAA